MTNNGSKSKKTQGLGSSSKKSKAATKPKVIKQPSKVPTAKESASKPKMTMHRRNASKASVKKQIAKLKESWAQMPTAEKAKRVTALLNAGCSIRGLAEGLGMSESTLRQYAPKSSRPEKAVELPAKEKLIPAPPAAKSAPTSRNVQLPPVSRNVNLSPGPSSLSATPDTPQPLAEPPSKAAPSISKSDLLAAVIVHLIHSIHGEHPTPTFVRNLLEEGRRYAQGKIFLRPKPIDLPSGASAERIAAITKPEQPTDLIDAGLAYEAKWLATILESMTQDRAIWESALSKAEQLVSDQGKSVDRTQELDPINSEPSPQTPPQIDRELKPYEIRLRNIVRSMTPEQRRQMQSQSGYGTLQTRFPRPFKGGPR